LIGAAESSRARLIELGPKRAPDGSGSQLDELCDASGSEAADRD
jgi:hypothetical protein